MSDDVWVNCGLEAVDTFEGGVDWQNAISTSRGNRVAQLMRQCSEDMADTSIEWATMAGIMTLAKSGYGNRSSLATN